jgi:hypothetical protein
MGAAFCDLSKKYCSRNAANSPSISACSRRFMVMKQLRQNLRQLSAPAYWPHWVQLAITSSQAGQIEQRFPFRVSLLPPFEYVQRFYASPF